jgi:hypothetical protein
LPSSALSIVIKHILAWFRLRIKASNEFTLAIIYARAAFHNSHTLKYDSILRCRWYSKGNAEQDGDIENFILTKGGLFGKVKLAKFFKN